MKLEDQACSFELAKKLKELGVKQDSYFCWIISENANRFVIQKDELDGTQAFEWSAFTVAELGEMLPNGICSFKGNVGWRWECTADLNGDGYITSSGGETEADVRAKMLIYLLENRLMELPK